MEAPKIARVIYKHKIDNDIILEKYCKRWAENENIEFEKVSFKKCFSATKVYMNNVKFRDFHYRMLLGKIPTNRDLYTWKLRVNANCSFCEASDETLQHIFIDCKFVKRIWPFLEHPEGTSLISDTNQDINNFWLYDHNASLWDFQIFTRAAFTIGFRMLIIEKKNEY